MRGHGGGGGLAGPMCRFSNTAHLSQSETTTLKKPLLMTAFEEHNDDQITTEKGFHDHENASNPGLST